MRLIDADELERDYLCDEAGMPLNGNMKVNFATVRCWLRCQLPVDTVPVVRCKDCKYAIPKMGGIVCDRFGRTVKRKDDFCSYGETK